MKCEIHEGSRLWVGNLSYVAERQELRHIFERVGSVVDVYTPFDFDKGEGYNKGYAFVEMATPAEAAQAIDELDQSPGPGGRKMFVKSAKPR
jgi:RNA recognition motif-containing protein